MTYTPTTREVKEWYADSIDRLGGEGEFDRWLAEELRQAKEQAWDEGYWQGINGHTGPGNPYQTPSTTDRKQP